MKKHIIKFASLLIISVSILFSGMPVSAAATYRIPSAVRVGLYYKDGSVNTVLPVFDVSAEAGLLFGFMKDGDFSEIYREQGASKLYVLKDAFYYGGDGAFKEYDPKTAGAGPSASSGKYGPFHIKIGKNCPDAESAEALAEEYRKSGAGAYVAYADEWQVWAGAYKDEAEAQKEAKKIKAVHKGDVFSVITPSSNGVVLVNSKLQPLCAFDSNTSYFLIKPAPENNPPVINIKGKLYRGELEVRRQEGGNMTVVNIVTMQEYLYGNVPSEIGGKSPAEALKAQALVSKMYAINNLGKHAKAGFDLCPTTSCQVYKGYAAEVSECNKAIDEVKDKIITYDGKPAEQIFYFASSGGRTEDVKNVWGSSYPYLVSVEDKYEKIFTWTKTLRAADVKAMLPQLGDILGITVTGTAQSGRVTQLAVRGAKKSDPAIYSLEKTRTVFGLNSQLYTITTDADVYVAAPAYTPTVTASASPKAIAGASSEKPGSSAVSLPSGQTPLKTQLGGKKAVTAAGTVSLAGSGKKVILGADGKTNNVPEVPETYTFTGKGWGHAVGMSQEGAIGMGKAGFKYDEILTHYFQGTKIK